MAQPAGSPFSRIAVIGCGLVGGSFALASQQVPGVEEVLVVDDDPQTRRAAQARGLTVATDLRAAVGSVDLVALAVPVEQIAGVAATTSRWVQRQAILTDVGSVKGKIVRCVLQDAPALAETFVGGHPMAGSERQGFGGADRTLFEGATYVLTPVRSTSASALAAVGTHARCLGGRILTVSPETHDRLVAVVSHLPQLLSSALMRHAAASASVDPGLLHMAGGGFRDVTRVAGSDPVLWTGILRENRDMVQESLRAFTAGLSELADAIAADDWDVVRRVLSEAREGRDLLPAKDTPRPVVDLVVPVPDEPGSLATVTTALGEAGVNIEDVSMRHVEEGGRGVLVVAVADTDAERARSVLEGSGLSAHIQRR